MKLKQTLLPLLLAALALPLAASAQDDEATEEIVVVGDKSIGQLRREVYEAIKESEKMQKE